MNICLIRHGETDWNIAGRLQGREDVPLNKNGELQAMNCGLALSKQTWKAVITSPLLRAKQTADIIAGVLGIREVYKDFDLIERDYGKASGLTPEERAELFPDNLGVLSRSGCIFPLVLGGKISTLPLTGKTSGRGKAGKTA